MSEINVQEEWLDIVDEQDRVIGSMSRAEAYQKKIFSSLRASWLMIKNSRGELWIPRRHFSKKILPGALDGSVAGHVSTGESYEQALVREAAEEVGIDLTTLPYRLIGKLDPHVEGTFCFMQVYEVSLEAVPKWNHDDFAEYYWLTPQAIVDRIAAGEPAKADLEILVRTFYLKKDQQ
jgi:isopentenyldiphosphate isomerase